MRNRECRRLVILARVSALDQTAELLKSQKEMNEMVTESLAATEELTSGFQVKIVFKPILKIERFGKGFPVQQMDCPVS